MLAVHCSNQGDVPGFFLETKKDFPNIFWCSQFFLVHSIKQLYVSVLFSGRWHKTHQLDVYRYLKDQKKSEFQKHIDWCNVRKYCKKYHEEVTVEMLLLQKSVEKKLTSSIVPSSSIAWNKIKVEWLQKYPVYMQAWKLPVQP